VKLYFAGLPPPPPVEGHLPLYNMFYLLTSTDPSHHMVLISVLPPLTYSPPSPSPPLKVYEILIT
jgi:hypothetical protein